MGARGWLSWGLGCAFAVLVFAQQTGYAVTNPSVAASLGLDLAQVGWVGSSYALVFAVAQLASGPLLDRAGSRVVLPAACAVVAAGAFLFANAGDAAGLVAANAVTALGASFAFIGAGFLGGEWFGARRYALMFALVQLLASLAAIATQRLFARWIESTGWDALIRGVGWTAAATALALAVGLREGPGVREARRARVSRHWLRGLRSDLFAVLGPAAGRTNALVGGLGMGAVLAVGVVWGPRFLTASGLDEASAFRATSFAWAGMALGAPALAWLSDRLRRRRAVLAAGLSLELAALVATAVAPDAAPWTLFAFGLGAGSAMLPFAIAAELAGPARVGTSAAVVNAVQFSLGGLFMAAPGVVLERLDGAGRDAHLAALAVLPAALALGLVLCRLLPETYPRPGGDAATTDR